MRKYFNIDFMRLVRLLTPPILRGAKLLHAILMACIYPIERLYNDFMRFRNSAKYDLKATPQVFSLEKVLNDRFDNVERRIYIADGAYYEQIYLFTEGEGKPIFIYAKSENKPFYLHTNREVGAESADFVVCIPRFLIYNDAEMGAIIDKYKLVSKTYIIVKI